jgi:outer membrane protein assembly factor BamA
MEDLFRTLPVLLKEFDDNQTVRRAVIFAAWRRIAGESLAEHAVAIILNKKHLTVAVTSERWQKYLKDLTGQMIFKLNSALGQAAVTFIEFCVDEKAVIEARQRRGGKSFDDEELQKLAAKQLSPQLRAKAKNIKDESLRQEFLKAASISLAKKETLKKRR